MSTTGIFIATFVTLTIFAVPAFAQTFIEPTTPFGGVTASPINTSETAQRKTGSLLIGTSSTSSYICLNANANGEVDAQGYPKCITSWSGIGADYVIVHTGPTDPPTTGTVPAVAATQNGYARIKGTGTQAYSIIAEAANVSSSTAIWAKEGSAGSFAGYFEGRLYIGDGTAGSSKQLCLNGTGALDSSTGKGCISDWNDIANIAQIGPYVYLQAVPGPTTVQVGGEALTGAGVFQQSVVLGVPENNTPMAYTCGDGICSGTVSNPDETSASCPIASGGDC